MLSAVSRQVNAEESPPGVSCRPSPAHPMF